MKDELKKEITDLQKLEGWMTTEKGEAMAELVLEHKPLMVVEIGIFGGRSMAAQGIACRENGVGKVYGIDPWKLESALEGDVGKENAEWWSKNMDLHNIHKGCMEDLWRLNLDEWCIVIRAASQHCASLFKKIDVLHIDGNHSELTSCRDVQLYVPKVRKGGFIWFDDTDWSTTKKAVKLMEEMAHKVREVGTCHLYQKR